MTYRSALLSGAVGAPVSLALAVLAVAGCARLERISEEGGLVGRVLAPEQASGPEPTPASAVDPAVPVPAVPLPYGPADFEHHAADQQFAWHWTTARASDRIEVKGLIEYRNGPAVRGVTLRLEGPGGSVDVDAPGLIRPGQARPFFFTAPYPGDGRTGRLSIVAVDRAPVPIETPAGRADRPEAPAGRQSAQSRADALGGHGRDHFFSLNWNTSQKGGEIEIRGIVENWNGPVVKDVALRVRAFGPAGEPLTSQRLVLRGPFDKKAVRAFAVTLAPGREPERIGVEVISYEFYQPRDK